MCGPSPRARRRRLLAAAVTTAVCLTFNVGQAGAGVPTAPKALPQIWGVAVDASVLRALDARDGVRLRRLGITLVAAPGQLSERQQSTLAKRAARWRVPVFAPLHVRRAASAESSALAATATCARTKRARPGSRCGLGADTIRQAAALSGAAVVDIVLVRVRNLAQLRRLARRGARSRVAAVLPVSARTSSRTLRRAVRLARRSRALDLVVRPTGRSREASLDRFLSRARKVGFAASTTAPSTPEKPTVTAAGTNSVTLGWDAAKGGARAVAYGVYRDGALLDRTERPPYRFSDLDCRPHLLEIDAVDRAGNRSAKASITAAPAGCDTPAPTPAPTPASTPAPRTIANLWIDTNGGSCTRTSSPAAYSDANACGSIDAANDKCQNGDFVLIRGGNYAGGGQNIDGSAGRTAMCRIDVLTGERALMKRLSLSAVKWLTLRGVESLEMDCSNGGFSCSDNAMVPNNKRAVYVTSGSEDVVIENISYGGFGIFDSRRVTIRGSDFGPCDSYDGQDPGARGQEGCPNGPIQYCEVAELQCTGYNEGHLIENNVIHDFGCDDSFFNGTGSDDCHWECMYVSYASKLTVRGNTFRNCANGGNIFHTFSNGGGSFTADFGFRDYTLENNVFEESCNNRSSPCGGRLDTASGIGHCNIYGGTDLTNVKVRHNTFLGGSTFALDAPCSQAPGNGLQIVGNLMKHTSVTCGVGWTPEYVAYNVYSGSGGTCGSNAATAGSSFVNAIMSDTNGGDAHLRGAPGSTVADRRVPVTVRGGCPGSDLDGDARPTTGSCSAGADER